MHLSSDDSPRTSLPPEELIGLRAVAYTIDSVISVALMSISFLGIVLAMLVSGGEELTGAGVAVVVVSMVLGFGLGFGVFLFRDALPGGGIGKVIAGIRVVDAASLRPCRVTQSFVRNFVFLVVGAIDGVIPLFSTDGRRLGDHVARTIVVRRRHLSQR
jgi:uncharacterized RDD family membrane protein YckC